MLIHTHVLTCLHLTHLSLSNCMLSNLHNVCVEGGVCVCVYVCVCVCKSACVMEFIHSTFSFLCHVLIFNNFLMYTSLFFSIFIFILLVFVLNLFTRLFITSITIFQYSNTNTIFSPSSNDFLTFPP